MKLPVCQQVEQRHIIRKEMGKSRDYDYIIVNVANTTERLLIPLDGPVPSCRTCIQMYKTWNHRSLKINF